MFFRNGKLTSQNEKLDLHDPQNAGLVETIVKANDVSINP